jgi:hypothetical protein
VDHRFAIVATSIVAALSVAGCGSDAATSTAAAPEQAVIVHLLNTNFDELVRIEDRLDPAITRAGVGIYDGNEIAVDGSEAVLYAYGPDADALWDVMEPIIADASPPSGSYAVKYYGDVGDPTTHHVRVLL